jgi:hypothetical protein
MDDLDEAAQRTLLWAAERLFEYQFEAIMLFMAYMIFHLPEHLPELVPYMLEPLGTSWTRFGRVKYLLIKK